MTQTMDEPHHSLESLMEALEDPSTSPPPTPVPTLASYAPISWGTHPDHYLVHSDPSATSEELKELTRAINALREEIFLTRTQLENLKDNVNERLSNIDFRAAKKNRTQENRCTFMSKRSQQCRGYICKEKGSILCYAHHVMATSLTDTERRKKLF